MAKLKTRRQVVGRWGEELAERYLVDHGCLILGKNIRTGYGEIDLIAQKDGVVLFVEVKTRTNLAFGLPETAITTRKQTHMLQAAEAYLQEHPEIGSTWQIDVVAIQGSPAHGEAEIVYFENAIN